MQQHGRALALRLLQKGIKPLSRLVELLLPDRTSPGTATDGPAECPAVATYALAC